MKKTQEVAVKDKQELAQVDELSAELDALFPKEQSNFTRIQLPRIAFSSQDVTEGKGKSMKVITEAGTFSLETETTEIDENNKKVWEKVELGSSFEGIIIYSRKQLSFFDEKTEKYVSSPVYDDNSEIIPLWSDKKQIAKGTREELRKLYEFVADDGKTRSKLVDNRILYVLIKDNGDFLELRQLNLHGSSMYSFMKYTKNLNPSKVVTKFSSAPQSKGSIEWNMMTFEPTRYLESEELINVLAKVKEIVIAIGLEKGALASKTVEYVEKQKEAEKKFDDF